MALATTCPACSTSFKVNPEQLKLRRGLVRCGKCEHVFSGVEYLRYVSDTQTDADLNPPDPGGDRRRGDRRATRRSAPDDDSATDELKTAFFLPESEFREQDSSDLTPIADADADDGARDESGAAPPAPASPPAGKRSRKNRRRKRGKNQAAANKQNQNSSEPDAETAQPADQSAADDADNQSGPAIIAPPADPSPVDDISTEPQRETAPASTGTAVDAVDNANGQTDAASVAAPREPLSPAPVRTTPLTQSPRVQSNGKSGRNDTSWVPAPLWPSIDEHFDDPDIEEPDSAPGPRPLEGPAGRSASLLNDGAARADGPRQTSDEDAIDFFGQTSRPSFDFDLPSKRAWLVAVALALILVVQLVVGNRDVLASRFPAMASTIGVLSTPFGLQVQLPMDSESIKIASFDLVTASAREPDASYVMNLLMRNKASYTVRWPAIELTLLDDAGGILVRKILPAGQYINDPLMLAAGLSASSEHPIRVGLKSRTSAPVGYSVSLFYP